MKFTKGELMAVTAARELQDGDKVIVGIGLPQVAAFLAKHTHAPNIQLLMEHGVFSSAPKDPSVGIADPRAWYGAKGFGGFIDVMGKILHRGCVDVGMLGALEIDKYGNINSTMVKLGEGKFRHFTGSGGANDMAVLAKKILVIMRHEARKFKEVVDFITSPGFLSGGDSRKKEGLRGDGPFRIITNMAVLGFGRESKELQVISIHPGVERSAVQKNTGFKLHFPNTIAETDRPAKEELEIIRNKLDPKGLYTN